MTNKSGIAARMFKTGRARYKAGDKVSFPESQFNDFLSVGLVSLAEEPGEVPESELPTPGNKPARKSINKGSKQ